MATAEDFEIAFGKVGEATTNIGNKITELRDQLANGGLTKAEEAEILEKLGAVADNLVNLAMDPANPVPEE